LPRIPVSTGKWVRVFDKLLGLFGQIDGLGFQSTRVGCKTSEHETHSRVGKEVARDIHIVPELKRLCHISS
jgi:hypothetical protein